MTAADLYHGWFYHQGALRLNSSLGWGIQMLREDARRRGLREASDRLESAWSNIRGQVAQVPYAAHPAIADTALPNYVRDWFVHREPGPYWTELDISQRFDQVQIPALHVAGWFDTYLEGSISGYLGLRACAGCEFARENQYLIAGPWMHIPWGDRAGESIFGEAANLNMDETLLRWFNHWLMDSEEFKAEPRIRYFAIGSNEWRTTQEWPTPSVFPLHLRSKGNANSRKGDGLLSRATPDQDEPRDVFVYDPEVPTLAPGGVQALSGSYDQSALELGNNLLVYSTEPVARKTEIFGQPRIRLFAATSAGNADFTAKIVRVTNESRAEFASIGIARSAWLFRNASYSADKVHAWEFTLEPLALVLFPGERLRLEIASSAFPLYDRNPSTDVPPQLADNWSWGRSTQQVLHTAEYPSAIYLPFNGEPGW
jgi:putative CocE/NonD family hydrolase